MITPTSHSTDPASNHRTGGSNNGSVSTVLLALTLPLAFLTAHAAQFVDAADKLSYISASLAHGVFYLVAVWWVVNKPTSHKDLVLILLAAVILRGLATTALPYLTTDAFRYVWDGRLGWAGVNPYAWPPADPNLAGFRDSAVYPHLNQKETAVTIYPPVAQMIFMFGVWLKDGIAGMKIAMLLFEGLTVIALLAWLRAEKLPPARILIYAWHPLPIWEFASQAHIDAAATAFLCLGIWAALRHRQGLTGALFACAMLVKYFPIVLLPALWKRWDWRLPAALLVTSALLYLPYLSTSNDKLAGFLSKHLANEGYQAGYGFHPVWLLRDFSLADPPVQLYLALALTILAGLAAWSLFAREADTIKPMHLAVLGAVFVFLTSPHYPWYFGFLVALAVRMPHPALLAMTLLCVVMNAPAGAGVSRSMVYTLTYYVPAGIWFAMWGWQQWSNNRSNRARPAHDG